jgi:hypothetical protein
VKNTGFSRPFGTLREGGLRSKKRLPCRTRGHATDFCSCSRAFGIARKVAETCPHCPLTSTQVRDGPAPSYSSSQRSDRILAGQTAAAVFHSRVDRKKRWQQVRGRSTFAKRGVKYTGLFRCRSASKWNPALGGTEWQQRSYLHHGAANSSCDSSLCSTCVIVLRAVSSSEKAQR